MKVLLLTQYFPPETGAPQNRLFDLAQKLQSYGDDVTILTGFPNYPQYEIHMPYRGKWYMKEEMSGLCIHRSYIYVSKQTGIFHRLMNYFSFTISSLIIGILKVGSVDLIICESPPLFLGWTGVLLKWVKKAKLVFNVSDLWPESAVKLGIVKNNFIIRRSIWLEEWIYKRSDKISGQTQGIVENIRARFPDKPYFWLRNGVDAEELHMRLTARNWRKEQGFSDQDTLFYFGGLIGYAQGLDCIIEAAGQLKDIADIKFIIIGEGPDKERLVKLKEELDAEQVCFFPGVGKAEIADIINSVDIGIIPLKKLDIFLGAIPSKIFEILSLGKPVLLGIEGEAKTLFIDQASAGLAFEPENARDLAEKIRGLLSNPTQIKTLGQNGQQFVHQYFDRKEIARSFHEFIHSDSEMAVRTSDSL